MKTSLLIVCIFAFGGCINAAAEYKAPETFTIAAVHTTACPPCTAGETAYVWRSIVRMAVEEINDDPDLLPDTKLILKHYETRGDSGIASLSMAEAVHDGAEVILGAYHSVCSKAMAMIGNEYKMPQVSFGSTNGQLSDKGTYKYFTRSVAPDDNLVPALAALAKDMKWTTVATLNTQDPFSSGAINAFKNAFRAIGGKIETSAESIFPSTEATMKAAMQQVKDSKAKVLVSFLVGPDYQKAFQSAYDLGLTGSNALVWILPTAEFPYPGGMTFSSDKVWDAVVAGSIGVQPYLGGGAVYDKWNALWRAKAKCDSPGCDNPFSASKVTNQYTSTDKDLAGITFGSYILDALLSIVYSVDDLIQNKKAMCHQVATNPCATKKGLLEVEFNETCITDTPCTTAFHERLFSLSALKKDALTGILEWEEDTKDRILQYEVTNWRKADDGGARFLAAFNQDTKKFTPDVHELAMDGKIVFNGGSTIIPKDKVVAVEEESYAQYIVLPIGAGIALLVVASAAWKQDMALEALLALMQDTLLLAGSLTLEFLDIISDCIVLVTIYDRDDLEEFRMWYAFFFGTGSLVFVCHVLVNAYFLFLMMVNEDDSSFTKLKKEVMSRQTTWKHAVVRREDSKSTKRVHSVGMNAETGELLTALQLKRTFVMTAHNTRKTLAHIKRLIGLAALLVFEDLPMMIMNILIVNKDKSNHSKVALLLSMTIGTLMVAFKMSALTSLVNLRKLAIRGQKDSMDLLDELEKQ